MKTVTRSFALLTAGVLSLSLAACSDAEAPAPTSPSATSTEAPATEVPIDETAPAGAADALTAFLDAQYSYSAETVGAFTDAYSAGTADPLALLNEYFPEMMATVDQSMLGNMPQALSQAMTGLSLLYSQDMTATTLVSPATLIVDETGVVVTTPESVTLTVSDSTGEIGSTPSDLTYKIGQVDGEWLVLADSFVSALPEPLPEPIPEG